MEDVSTVKYMKRITIITSILLFLSVILGVIQHSQITKFCMSHVKYVTELNNSTTYTFGQCYGMQSDASLLGFLHIITFISIIIFILKLLSCGISYFSNKIKNN